MEKFLEHSNGHSNGFVSRPDGRSPSPRVHDNQLNEFRPPDRWQPRRESLSQGTQWSGKFMAERFPGRQKTLGDTFRTIRARRGSVSANAHDIAEALKAPVSPKLILLCIVWYLTSALTNTSSKSILNAFPKPATLTVVQFLFVAVFCIFFSWLATIFPRLKTTIPALRHGILSPSRDVIRTTLPLAVFQVGGHLLSSTATAKIPVSLVHTIKGLSPLFTVIAYRVIFDIRYPAATYLSLIPLTVGVMLACSAELRGNIIGIFCALLAALIFVTQNIFSKRLFNEAAKAEAEGEYQRSQKLDKLNLLCYSSGLAFLLTSPIWFCSEGLYLLKEFFHDGSIGLVNHPKGFDHGRLSIEFVFNGTFHFGQNIIAFILLSMVSPVTYSVASLIKRVFVVVIAIFWFRNSTTFIQGVGIALTFFGLYLYDRTSDSNKADRRARMLDIKEEPLLPLKMHISKPNGPPSASVFESPNSANEATLETKFPSSNGFAVAPVTGEDHRWKEDMHIGRRSRGHSNAAWLPSGLRPEEMLRA